MASMSDARSSGKGEAGTVRVRRIHSNEAALLRALRLRALAESPEAFGETMAEAEARDEAEYAARARAGSRGDRRAWFVAELSGGREPVGLALGRRRPPADCMIFSVWVADEARGRGIGRALVHAIVDWARAWGAETIVLWVFRANVGAIAFYERLGFVLDDAGPDADLGSPHGAVAMHLAVRATD
jgi:GNAT superfamily N-acetyltransferase